MSWIQLIIEAPSILNAREKGGKQVSLKTEISMTRKTISATAWQTYPFSLTFCHWLHKCLQQQALHSDGIRVKMEMSKRFTRLHCTRPFCFLLLFLLWQIQYFKWVLIIKTTLAFNRSIIAEDTNTTPKFCAMTICSLGS